MEFQSTCDGCRQFRPIVQVLQIRDDSITAPRSTQHQRCEDCRLDLPIPQHSLSGTNCRRCGTWKGFLKRNRCMTLRSELEAAVEHQVRTSVEMA